jgi:hypothetical protein
MNELQRLAYLQAMDIQPYFPRKVLPGAKPSPHYDIPVAPARVAKPEKAANVAQAKQGIRGAGLATIDELRSTPESVRKATVTPILQQNKEVAERPDSKTVVEQESTLRFTLRYYRIDDRLVVLDEVPSQGSDQLGRESRKLVQAILKALGCSSAELSMQVEEFSWPVQSGYFMKNSPEVEAARAISGFLQMRQETDGFANLLIFAGQVEELFLQNAPDKTARDFESSKGYHISVTHSLASMLAVPNLKRDVWQHLQPLRKRIDGSS